MKSVSKKILFILVILMLLFSISSKVYAFGEIIQDGKDFIGSADPEKASIDQADIQNISGFLYNVLLSAGVVIAVIVATVLGIQFMMGGAEGQAKVKEMLIPFVVGCVIVFGAFGIWKIALSVGQQLERAGGGTSSPQSTQTQQSTQQSTQAQQSAQDYYQDATVSPYIDGHTSTR